MSAAGIGSSVARSRARATPDERRHRALTLYCFCAGGAAASGADGTCAASTAGAAPRSPAASAQSPAHSFVPRTVPTSLQPEPGLLAFGFICASGLLLTVGAGWANALLAKTRAATTISGLMFIPLGGPLWLFRKQLVSVICTDAPEPPCEARRSVLGPRPPHVSESEGQTQRTISSGNNRGRRKRAILPVKLPSPPPGAPHWVGGLGAALRSPRPGPFVRSPSVVAEITSSGRTAPARRG